MTDFVDRLLGRAEVPPIRPLLPTLFEPRRRDDSEDLPMGAVTPGSSPEPPAAPVHPAERDEHSRAEQSPNPQLVATPAVGAPAADARPSEPAVPAATRELLHTRTLSEQSTVTALTERLVMPGRPPAVDDRSRPTTETPPAPTSAATPQRTSITAPTVVDPPKPAAARSKPSLRRQIRTETPRHEPDVHITIGRLEIKSCAESLPARKPPAGDARRRGLSLEEYLKARGS